MYCLCIVGRVKSDRLKDSKEIGGRYYNDGEDTTHAFPPSTTPVKVPGDTCTLYVECTSVSSTSWGFKVVAYAQKTAPSLSLPWLFNIQRTLTYMIGKVSYLADFFTHSDISRAHIMISL